MFDINGSEFLILLVVAVLVIGPQRLPKYAAQLAQLIKRLRVLVQETKVRVGEELGDDIKDVDWAVLDPRRYDPRRIVREALVDDVTPVISGGSLRATRPVKTTSGPAPSDDEAT